MSRPTADDVSLQSARAACSVAKRLNMRAPYRRRFTVLVVVMFALLLSACSSSSRSVTASTTTTVPASAHTYTQSDNGKQVVLSSGESVRIELPGNVTTGFSWVITRSPTPTIVRLVSSQYRPGSCAPGAAGCGGTQVLDLTAVGAGETSIALTYEQPWAGGAHGGTYDLAFRV